MIGFLGNLPLISTAATPVYIPAHDVSWAVLMVSVKANCHSCVRSSGHTHQQRERGFTSLKNNEQGKAASCLVSKWRACAVAWRQVARAKRKSLVSLGTGIRVHGGLLCRHLHLLAYTIWVPSQAEGMVRWMTDQVKKLSQSSEKGKVILHLSWVRDGVRQGMTWKEREEVRSSKERKDYEVSELSLPAP